MYTNLKGDIMNKILCFGDSNTYGLRPDGAGRYSNEIRWTGLIQKNLGLDYFVIEEGLCGRTTIFEDKARFLRSGIDYLKPFLESHDDIDLVIIMLGTNDCKSLYNNSSKDIAHGIELLVDVIHKKSEASILIVSPIHLGEKVYIIDKDFSENSIKVSKQLAVEYEKTAKENACDFLDASKFAISSEVDMQHLDEKGHFSLANAIAEKIKICLNSRI